MTSPKSSSSTPPVPFQKKILREFALLLVVLATAFALDGVASLMSASQEGWEALVALVSAGYAVLVPELVGNFSILIAMAGSGGLVYLARQQAAGLLHEGKLSRGEVVWHLSLFGVVGVVMVEGTVPSGSLGALVAFYVCSTLLWASLLLVWLAKDVVLLATVGVLLWLAHLGWSVATAEKWIPAALLSCLSVVSALRIVYAYLPDERQGAAPASNEPPPTSS